MKNVTIHKKCEKCKKKNVCKFVNADPELLLYDDTDILNILKVEFTCTEYEECPPGVESLADAPDDKNWNNRLIKITKEMRPYQYENNIIYSDNGLNFYWADGRPVSQDIADRVRKSITSVACNSSSETNDGRIYTYVY